jgi:pimeloyl-ACP methyl ester carboxylesterase
MDTLSLLRRFNAVAGRVAPAVPARIARNLALRPRRGARPADDGGGRRVSFRFGLSGLRWGDSGPAVLALHGWEGRPAQFAPLARALVAAGRQVIALEAPAHGEAPGREATLMEFAAALEEAAVEVAGLESVVGHSLGGAAAAIALSRGLPAERAVLVAAPSSIEDSLLGFAGAMGLPAAAARRFVNLVEDANGVRARELEVARLAPRLRQPALVVHDHDDAKVPFGDARAIAGAWPGARLLATRGLGHSRLLADAGVVRAVTRFLAAPAAGRLAAAG